MKPPNPTIGNPSTGLGAHSGGETDEHPTPMKPRPEPSTQEVLAGLVERVTFHNAENGFCVLGRRPRGHRELVTVVGHAATISAGHLGVGRAIRR